jgi:hypothetical protein
VVSAARETVSLAAGAGACAWVVVVVAAAAWSLLMAAASLRMAEARTTVNLGDDAVSCMPVDVPVAVGG